MPCLARALALVTGLLVLVPQSGAAKAASVDPDSLIFDPERAIAHSQAALGGRLSDHAFIDQDGRPVRLSQYDGNPLVISLVYTACVEACPVLIERLAEAVAVAREALGENRFSVITVGFDAEKDRPARLKSFAKTHGIDLRDWRFLSGDAATINALVEELGFLRLASPRGFDHIAQVSVVDDERRIFSHVYGAELEPPALVEPLKALVFDELSGPLRFDEIVERIRLFCTFYDPATGRYALDYSFIISLTVGGLALLGLALVLVRAWLRSGQLPGGPA